MGILSWLPVQSLFRFKFVAKSWDITSDPYFKMKHQRYHANSTKFFVDHCYLNRKNNFYSTSSLSSPDDIQKLDDLPPKSHILFGSCDDLVLIGVASQFLLWNPSTRESILLPPRNLEYSIPFLHWDTIKLRMTTWYLQFTMT
ncbi:hypothetical protein R3W88_014795 [Solanum pinnatisectum]|uniref:Uncharacterized protein n=1 Tax=Solanum pinnatisectum TaxID=50273 RepID=A0AAV9KX25_9SOLN|nr:hypothetical protein R3W88_014795 [Solanum pinnatisectum]